LQCILNTKILKIFVGDFLVLTTFYVASSLHKAVEEEAKHPKVSITTYVGHQASFRVQVANTYQGTAVQNVSAATISEGWLAHRH